MRGGSVLGFMVYALLLWTGLGRASQDWVPAARLEIPDRISIETELRHFGLEAESASYLGGQTAWGTAHGGQTVARHSLRWLRLNGEPVLPETAVDAVGGWHHRGQCELILGQDPVPGGRILHLYRSSPFDHDLQMEAALGERPGMVLATGEQGEIAMVSLRPGDQVLLVDVEHRRTGAHAEHLELHRGDRWLTLSRDGGPPRACYGQD